MALEVALAGVLAAFIALAVVTAVALACGFFSKRNLNTYVQQIQAAAHVAPLQDCERLDTVPVAPHTLTRVSEAVTGLDSEEVDTVQMPGGDNPADFFLTAGPSGFLDSAGTLAAQSSLQPTILEQQESMFQQPHVLSLGQTPNDRVATSGSAGAAFNLERLIGNMRNSHTGHSQQLQLVASSSAGHPQITSYASLSSQLQSIHSTALASQSGRHGSILGTNSHVLATAALPGAGNNPSSSGAVRERIMVMSNIDSAESNTFSFAGLVGMARDARFTSTSKSGLGATGSTVTEAVSTQPSARMTALHAFARSHRQRMDSGNAARQASAAPPPHQYFQQPPDQPPNGLTTNNIHMLPQYSSVSTLPHAQHGSAGRRSRPMHRTSSFNSAVSSTSLFGRSGTALGGAFDESRELETAARLVAAVLPDVMLTGILGSGAHGTVYKAKYNGKIVAVKVVAHEAPPEDLTTPSETPATRLAPVTFTQMVATPDVPVLHGEHQAVPFEYLPVQILKAHSERLKKLHVDAHRPDPYPADHLLAIGESGETPQSHDGPMARERSIAEGGLPMPTIVPVVMVPADTGNAGGQGGQQQSEGMSAEQRRIMEGLVGLTAQHPNIVKAWKVAVQQVGRPEIPALVLTRTHAADHMPWNAPGSRRHGRHSAGGYDQEDRDTVSLSLSAAHAFVSGPTLSLVRHDGDVVHSVTAGPRSLLAGGSALIGGAAGAAAARNGIDTGRGGHIANAGSVSCVQPAQDSTVIHSVIPEEMLDTLVSTCHDPPMVQQSMTVLTRKLSSGTNVIDSQTSETMQSQTQLQRTCSMSSARSRSAAHISDAQGWKIELIHSRTNTHDEGQLSVGASPGLVSISQYAQRAEHDMSRSQSYLQTDFLTRKVDTSERVQPVDLRAVRTAEQSQAADNISSETVNANHGPTESSSHAQQLGLQAPAVNSSAEPSLTLSYLEGLAQALQDGTLKAEDASPPARINLHASAGPTRPTTRPYDLTSFAPLNVHDAAAKTAVQVDNLSTVMLDTALHAPRDMRDAVSKQTAGMEGWNFYTRRHHSFTGISPFVFDKRTSGAVPADAVPDRRRSTSSLAPRNESQQLSLCDVQIAASNRRAFPLAISASGQAIMHHHAQHFGGMGAHGAGNTSTSSHGESSAHGAGVHGSRTPVSSAAGKTPPLSPTASAAAVATPQRGPEKRPSARQLQVRAAMNSFRKHATAADLLVPDLGRASDVDANVVTPDTGGSALLLPPDPNQQEAGLTHNDADASMHVTWGLESVTQSGGADFSAHLKPNRVPTRSILRQSVDAAQAFGRQAGSDGGAWPRGAVRRARSVRFRRRSSSAYECSPSVSDVLGTSASPQNKVTTAEGLKVQQGGSQEGDHDPVRVLKTTLAHCSQDGCLHSHQGHTASHVQQQETVHRSQSVLHDVKPTGSESAAVIAYEKQQGAPQLHVPTVIKGSTRHDPAPSTSTTTERPAVSEALATSLLVTQQPSDTGHGTPRPQIQLSQHIAGVTAGASAQCRSIDMVSTSRTSSLQTPPGSGLAAAGGSLDRASSSFGTGSSSSVPMSRRHISQDGGGGGSRVGPSKRLSPPLLSHGDASAGDASPGIDLLFTQDRTNNMFTQGVFSSTLCQLMELLGSHSQAGGGGGGGGERGRAPNVSTSGGHVITTQDMLGMVLTSLRSSQTHNTTSSLATPNTRASETYLDSADVHIPAPGRPPRLPTSSSIRSSSHSHASAMRSDRDRSTTRSLMASRHHSPSPQHAFVALPGSRSRDAADVSMEMPVSQDLKPFSMTQSFSERQNAGAHRTQWAQTWGVGGRHAYRTFIVQEYCSEGNFQEALQRGAFHKANVESGTQEIDLKSMVNVLLQVAHGMSYLHSLGLIHGDLKCANVMLQTAQDLSTKSSKADTKERTSTSSAQTGAAVSQGHHSSHPPSHTSSVVLGPAAPSRSNTHSSYTSQHSPRSQLNPTEHSLLREHSMNSQNSNMQPSSHAVVLGSCFQSGPQTSAGTSYKVTAGAAQSSNNHQQLQTCSHGVETVPGGGTAGNVPLPTTGDRNGINCTWIAKLADFGLARVLSGGRPSGQLELGPQQVMVSRIGTVSHAPPETLRDSLVLLASDVYSFGCLIWEAYNAGEKPLAHLTPYQMMQAVVVDGIRPAFPTHCPPAIAQLAADCMEHSHMARPSFEQVVNRLETLAATLPATITVPLHDAEGIMSLHLTSPTHSTVGRSAGTSAAGNVVHAGTPPYVTAETQQDLWLPSVLSQGLSTVGTRANVQVTVAGLSLYDAPATYLDA